MISNRRNALTNQAKSETKLLETYKVDVCSENIYQFDSSDKDEQAIQILKSKSLAEFVRLVKRLVVGQFQELRSALCTTGDFRLTDSHKHFQVSKSSWIEMTETQGANLYKCYRTSVVHRERHVTSTDGLSTCIAPRTEGKEPGGR